MNRLICFKIQILFLKPTIDVGTYKICFGWNIFYCYTFGVPTSYYSDEIRFWCTIFRMKYGWGKIFFCCNTVLMKYEYCRLFYASPLIFSFCYLFSLKTVTDKPIIYLCLHFSNININLSQILLFILFPPLPKKKIPGARSDVLVPHLQPLFTNIIWYFLVKSVKR